jgi:hypothetical protein
MNRKTNGGFIKWVIIIVIALIILGYYGFDVREAIESPTTQSNLIYAKQVVSNIWHNYLRVPTLYIWSQIFEFIKAHCYPQFLCYIVGAK